MSIDKKQLSKLLSYMATFDGGIYEPYKRNTDSKVNCMFVLNMRKENLDYVNWVKETVENITGVRVTDRVDYNTEVRLESQRHPYLTKLRERIYIDKHKVIDPHMLTLMDAEALAIIFMADGSSSLDTRGKTPSSSITLETKGFSYADNLSLSKAIYKATGIRSNVNRSGKYYMLYIKKADHQLFVDTVMPHMLPSFLYKLERLAPALQDGDIVCSSVKAEEVSRND